MVDTSVAPEPPLPFLAIVWNCIEAVYEMFIIDHWFEECYTIFLL